MKTLYVGNLPFSSTEAEIRELFGLHGEVRNVNIVLDRQTGKPRGFAFVSMDDEPAAKALAALNGQLFAGRRLQVNEARPPAERTADGQRPDRRERSGDRPPFRPRPGFDENRSGDRPPFRPRPRFDENRSGDRPPFRPRPRFDENQPDTDNYYHFQDEDEMGGEDSAPSSFEERRPHTPHRSFNNRKTFRSRRDKDSDDGFRRPRRPFRGGRQSRDNGYSSDDDED